MAQAKERRTILRVPLSDNHTVRTHDGVEARLIDLSVRGAHVEHLGILRPGALCILELPPELGSLLLSAQVVWCTILGAEWRLDGERHLRAQSGLWFNRITESQRAALAGILQQLSTGDLISMNSRQGSA